MVSPKQAGQGRPFSLGQMQILKVGLACRWLIYEEPTGARKKRGRAGQEGGRCGVTRMWAVVELLEVVREPLKTILSGGGKEVAVPPQLPLGVWLSPS